MHMVIKKIVVVHNIKVRKLVLVKGWTGWMPLGAISRHVNMEFMRS